MNTKLTFGSYLLGKIIRFIFYLIFLFSLVNESQVLAAYNSTEVLIFFLTFNFLDISAQILFRGTYAIGHGLIKQGKFDFVLLKPFSPLLHSLSHIVDFIDFFTLLALTPLLIWSMLQLDQLRITQILIYCLLLANGLIIAFAFHIFAGAIAILTFESHHVMFAYRNLTNMLRFPIDIYPGWMQLIMTTILPVGVMIAFPVKSLLGLFSGRLIVYALIVSALAIAASLKTWHWAIRHYQSASS